MPTLSAACCARPSFCAREELAVGRITPAAFKKIEDRAVDGSVRLQEDAGFEVVTDGEMRRLSFQSQMTEAVQGFGNWNLDAFLWGEWHGVEGAEDWRRERPADVGVVEKLVRKRHLSAEEFVYLRGHTRRIPKITIPSPGLFVNFWSPEISRDAYPTLDSFLADVVRILREEVEELVYLGAIYIQIDAPTIPCSSTPRPGRSTNPVAGRSRSGSILVSSSTTLSWATFLASPLASTSAAATRRAAGWSKATTRQSRNRSSGVFARTGYCSSKTTLARVPDDRMVVLGLVSTKRPTLEEPELLTRRIDEAARYVDKDRLALSPQCGFSTSIIGNELSIEDVKAKLRLVTETARRVWG